MKHEIQVLIFFPLRGPLWFFTSKLKPPEEGSCDHHGSFAISLGPVSESIGKLDKTLSIYKNWSKVQCKIILRK